MRSPYAVTPCGHHSTDNGPIGALGGLGAARRSALGAAFGAALGTAMTSALAAAPGAPGANAGASIGTAVVDRPAAAANRCRSATGWHSTIIWAWRSGGVIHWLER